MVVSGEGDDPMNDPSVKVGFYNSKDPMVKDGGGNVAKRYTFRIAPDAKFEAILNARTVNGEIVSTEAAPTRSGSAILATPARFSCCRRRSN